MERFDVAVLGGGMLGSAVAHGCAAAGARVALLDEGDVALRAARGNFGLVWSQGKGDGYPAYAEWTRQSLALWPALAETLGAIGGRHVAYRPVGGIAFCLGEADFAERAASVARQHNQGAAGLRMLDRAEMRALLPGTVLGAEVTGASYQPADGHVDSLALLAAFQAGLRLAGGAHLPGAPVTAVETVAGGYRVQRADGASLVAAKLVIAAGLGTPALAAMVGLDVPVRPVRGQNIVTERIAPLLPLPASGIRQTADGTIQIGVTYEDVGSYDPVTRTEDLARMAARAIRTLPQLAEVGAVRTWAALRPMTPDGYPAYAESPTHPGAFVAVCHSAVTLAAAHAGPLAAAILAGALPEALAPLHPARFVGMAGHVPAH